MIHKFPIDQTTEAGRQHWLQLRKKYIGGSEIGAIMGVNPYATAYTVYCEKKGLTPAFEGNDVTKLGHELEPIIARRFMELSGEKVAEPHSLFVNEKWPFMSATVDRLLKGGNSPWKGAGLEIKSTTGYSLKKYGDGEFPEQYYAQCVHYMTVLEKQNWFLAVMDRMNGHVDVYQLSTDPEMVKAEWAKDLVHVPQEDISSLIHAATQFHWRLANNMPPNMDGKEPTSDAIDVVYAEDSPMTRKGAKVNLLGNDDLIAEYMQAKADVDAAKEKAERLAQTIQIALDGAESGESMLYKVQWGFQKGRPNYKGLVAKHPELEPELEYGASYRTFKVTKKKK